MAADSNGHPKRPKGDKMNQRQPNGNLYGSDSPRYSSGGRKRRRNDAERFRPKTRYSDWVLDKALKATVWYTVLTVVFRCPSSPEGMVDGSPAICKPYLQVRDVITPYAQPYYDQYAAPYVQKAQPYVDRFNDTVYTPGLAGYRTHAAPRLSHAQQQALVFWEKTGKPQLDLARHQAGKQYEALLGPHVKKVQGAVQPYYNSVSTSAKDIWELELRPVYRNTAPYAQKLYTQGRGFTEKTLLPQVQYASAGAWSLWVKQVWPRMRVLYGENVEPQLMRITERLGRYKDGRKLQAEIKSMEYKSTMSDSSSRGASMASSVSSAATEAISSPSSAATAMASSATASPSATLAPAEPFREDLKSWETACSRAVEEGAEHLRERIAEIADHQINRQASGTGKALVTQLEDTAEGAINNVKARILAVVGTLPENAEPEELENANESLTQAIRNAGQMVKKSAQAVRDWKATYITSTDELVDKALQSTLETIDGIREIRLGEIGRKYADSGLPHKEWTKYNDLKKATRVWRDDVEKVVSGNAHIQRAKDAGEEVEGRGMHIAEDIAKELGRLKKVARYKVTVGDATDDFESKAIPASFERAKRAVKDTVSDASEAVVGSSKDAQSSVKSATSAASEKAADMASRASEAVYGSTGSAESVASRASASAESATEKAKANAEHVYAEVAEAPSSLASRASATLSSIADEAASSASSVASHASETPSSLAHKAASSASSAASEASDSAYSARSKFFAGANAQILVEARDPIYDTVDEGASVSEKIQSMADAAADRVAELTGAVMDAMKLAKPTSTTKGFTGSVQSVTSLASEQYESAMSAASSVLFGRQEVKGSQRARNVYESAVTAASYAIYGTPTTAAALSSVTSLADSVASKASSRYSAAMDEATSRYEAAKSRLSVQISGTPKPIHQQMFASVESAYSDSMSAASQALEAAVGAISTPAANLFSVSTQGPYESISSIASSRLAEGLSAASQQYQSAKIAVGAEPTPAHQAYLASAQVVYYQGIGMAHDRYSSFLDAASSAVGATPTTGYQAYVAAAQSTYSAALAAASSNMQQLLDSASSAAGATSKTPGEEYLETISAGYHSAVAGASSQLAAASSQASELFYGTTMNSYQQATEAAASAYTNVASQASSAIYGSETPYYEAMASQAKDNWEALVSRASEQVYGQPVPFTESVMSQAGAYAAQATQAAAQQYDAVQQLFSELVSGREPDFTDSVMSRLQSAYSTGAPAAVSSASSYASEAYATVSSAIASVFTPPASLDNMMDDINAQLNAAVDAASVQFYGSSKGTVESATEAAASAYSNAASQVSEAVYGHETGYAEAAQKSMSDIAAAASRSISEAIYGTPTGSVEAASHSAASVYNSLTSVASKQAASVSSAVSSVMYGEEQSYMDGLQSSISAAMASAQSRIAEFGEGASKAAADTMSHATEAVEAAASSVSSVASKATSRVREEL